MPNLRNREDLHGGEKGLLKDIHGGCDKTKIARIFESYKTNMVWKLPPSLEHAGPTSFELLKCMLFAQGSEQVAVLQKRGDGR